VLHRIRAAGKTVRTKVHMRSTLRNTSNSRESLWEPVAPYCSPTSSKLAIFVRASFRWGRQNSVRDSFGRHVLDSDIAAYFLHENLESRRSFWRRPVFGGARRSILK